jgi:phosphoribosylamine--glycine ligase
MAKLGLCLKGDPLEIAQSIRPDLTVVGPEAPLVAGVVDRFRSVGLPIVGPTSDNARLEGSKVFAKQFFEKHSLPTAKAVTVASFADAREALARFPLPVVIKADGLAAGKGVVIATTREEAEHAVLSLGPSLVIEEFLEGEEVSFIALCDGETAVPFEPTQDHKRIGDGDTGPNTGGMGAYCDSRILTSAQTGQILEKIIMPTVAATKFTGFLYAGLMMTSEGPKILEFNVRLGDPETQPLMDRMDDDLAPILLASATGALAGRSIRWRTEPSVCVVLAAAGYPGSPRTGDPIEGLEQCPATVFQAGTTIDNGRLVTSGGRVLGVTASGEDLSSAIANTYAAIPSIHFDGMYYRKDIGAKGLKRWSVSRQAGG